MHICSFTTRVQLKPVSGPSCPHLIAVSYVSGTTNRSILSQVVQTSSATERTPDNKTKYLPEFDSQT